MPEVGLEPSRPQPPAVGIARARAHRKLDGSSGESGSGGTVGSGGSGGTGGSGGSDGGRGSGGSSDRVGVGGYRVTLSPLVDGACSNAPVSGYARIGETAP